MKTGIVDVGGGYRGVYAAGVMDYCMDNGIKFDLGVGVSAGSANIISYAAGQQGRNYTFYTVYGLRRKYASFGNFIRKRSFIDMDYVYGTLSNCYGEYPLDYDAVMANPMELYFVASEAATGKPEYFDKSDIYYDDYNVLKASCAIPFVCHPYEVKGVPYFDGALADCVPIEKAFELGCDKVVLVLTKPKDVPREPGSDLKLAKGIEKKYPIAAQQMRSRAENYNKGVALAKEYEKQGKLLIIAPDDTCGVGTICKDAEAMNTLYYKGYNDGKKIKEFLQPFGH